MTGIHEYASRAMSIGLRMHSMKKRDFIGMTSEMGKHGAYQLARLALRRERPGTAHEIPIAALERKKILLSWQRCSVMLFQSRFMFPQIDVGGCTRAKNLKHSLGPGLVVGLPTARLPGSNSLSVVVLSHEGKEAHTSSRPIDVSQEGASMAKRLPGSFKRVVGRGWHGQSK